jgi:hypothetical protein
MLDLPHNEAFIALGVRAPVQQWSAFDVTREEARQGRAKHFVTTVWNYHSVKEDGKRIPTEIAICRDRKYASLWYMVPRPGTGARKTHVAHWNGIELALREAVPMTAILKDVATGLCSLSMLFHVMEVRYQADEAAMWLRLAPRGGLTCATREIVIDEVLAGRAGST